MKPLPRAVAAFLDHRVIAVAGVSRDGRSPANAILKKLRAEGRTVFAVNPNAAEIDGERCWPDVLSLPERAGAAVIVTRPSVAAAVVRQCAEAGIRDVWLHRSFGSGSVSDEAVREAERLGIRCIAGGCPMMYAGRVDFAHACFRTILGWRNRVPA
jgi:predicted CoA-binding protein